MFDKVLIANRGEIAVRIIRACRELGIRTVAVFSQADKNALHAQIADEAICIGGPNSKDSYLNVRAILSACQVTGATAIHPGFGFLSENSNFVRNCEKCGLTFIGPSADAMEQMGDKSNAKRTMENAGVPVIPGSKGEVKSLEEAYEICNKIGYPVMVKASAGGGGRGIRLVNTENELAKAIEDAKKEAYMFFSNDGIYIEKFLVNPRHVEIQIMADSHNNYVHLGERDCSLQRRNQKMLEEAPSPVLNHELRKKMGHAAINAAKACGYVNAGTIEFLLDNKNNFYFMEMNTRIQVEHPITEQITNIDIVKEQIKIAMGEKLSFCQHDVKIKGHAIECRINAENPDKDFLPSPGMISALHIPGGNGVRIDSAVYQGYVIPPYYDSMIAKLITYAPTRAEALAKMKRALTEFIVEGVNTNIDYLLKLVKNKSVEEGDYDIGFIGRLKNE